MRAFLRRILSTDFDSGLIGRALNMEKIDIDAFRSQTQPFPLSPLPADQEAWADSPMTQSDHELKGKVYHLNRPDAMTKEERRRDRRPSNLIHRWLEIRGSGHLKITTYAEQHYATMIMMYLIDGLLDRVEDMDLLR